MTAPERFADNSQIPLAPRAPSIHDPVAEFSNDLPAIGSDILITLPAGMKRCVNYCFCLFNDGAAIGAMWYCGERCPFRPRRANENPVVVAVLADH